MRNAECGPKAQRRMPKPRPPVPDPRSLRIAAVLCAALLCGGPGPAGDWCEQSMEQCAREASACWRLSHVAELGQCLKGPDRVGMICRGALVLGANRFGTVLDLSCAPELSWPCLVHDRDGDCDVDLYDVSLFQRGVYEP